MANGQLAGVGPRLRALRLENAMTLGDLAAATGISVSTLSRLESGQRRPTLELLMPLAELHGIALDDLVAPAAPRDPRVHGRAVRHDGMTMIPLSRRGGGIQAFKMILPGRKRQLPPDPRTHEGYEWLYVLDGRLRLVLGEHDLVVEPGEAAEFDTRVPHWFASAGPARVEVLSLFGREGERMHVRARSAKR